MNKKQLPSQKELDELLNYYRNKEYVEAEDLAKKISENFPNHSLALKILTSIYSLTNRLSESLILYKRLVELFPNDHEIHNNRANLLRGMGKLKEAEKSYSISIKLNPNFASAYNNLSITLKELGNLSDAEENSRKAIELDPNHAFAHNNLAIILLNQGRLEESENYCKNAIKLNPNLAEPYNNLGNAQKNGGKLEAAILSFKQAIKVEPNFAEAFHNIGATLQDQGKLVDAESYYKKAIELKPDHSEAFQNLGNLMYRLDRYNEAESYYKKAIELNPDNLDTHHLLSALKGVTTKTAPKTYIQKLFDNYANGFDKSLIDELHYNAPKIVSNAITNNFQNKSLGSVLDLGCGTGLFGEEIRNFCNYLEGVDLSSLMLNLARKRNVYDKLSKEDILDYLSKEGLDFDYFVFLDVFIYLGDLDDVFKLIYSQNKNSGKLVFTTENSKKENYFLEKSGRYSHSKSYIKMLCDKYGYDISYHENIKLRKESNRFIDGGLYILEFSKN